MFACMASAQQAQPQTQTDTAATVGAVGAVSSWTLDQADQATTVNPSMMTVASAQSNGAQPHGKNGPQIPYPCCGSRAPNPDGSCPPGSTRTKNPICGY